MEESSRPKVSSRQLDGYEMTWSINKSKFEDTVQRNREIALILEEVDHFCALSAFVSLVEQNTVKEALKDPKWVIAMQEELHQFDRNKVWRLVPKSDERTIVGTKWVFRNKLDE